MHTIKDIPRIGRYAILLKAGTVVDDNTNNDFFTKRVLNSLHKIQEPSIVWNPVGL